MTRLYVARVRAYGAGCLRLAISTGEQRIYGLALTGLAEAALLRDADVPKAKDLVQAALEALEDADASARVEA